MSELALYRQKRFDGGIRMGIESGDNVLFEVFEPGPPELEDEPMGSALQWYIDLRCEGRALPQRPEEARRWFEDRSQPIRMALLEFSNTIEVGIDDEFPLESSPIELDEQSTQMRIVCSVIRRVTRHDFSRVLLEYSQEFPRYLSKLTEPEPSRL